MSADDALKYAIKEIQNAPEIVEDPDLYAPLFKNVSVFKRYCYKLTIIVLFILLFFSHFLIARAIFFHCSQCHSLNDVFHIPIRFIRTDLCDRRCTLQ